MKHVDLPGLPPCSLSSDCLRLLDDFDEADIRQKPGQVFFTEDIRDERLLGKLRLHLPNCPTCTVILAQARRVRSQQRAILRDFLIGSEAPVSSTTSDILAAIRHEQNNGSRPGASDRWVGYYLQEIVMVPDPQKLNGKQHHDFETMPTGYAQSWLRNAMLLATVAALILFALGVFSHHIYRPVPAGHISAGVGSHGWDSVVVGLTMAAPGLSELIGIYNYNPANGRYVNLVSSSQVPANIRIDGISPDGRNLLYRFSASGHTMYSTSIPVKGTSFFYEMSDENAGNAVWMDNDHALIASRHNGVVLVNIHTCVSTNVFPMLKVKRLTFFRAPYLYFIGVTEHDEGTLYRIKLNAADTMPQIVSASAAGAGSSYWLSPDGSTIYYADREEYGWPHIRSVNNGGSYPRETLSEDFTAAGYAKPIGFAHDNSLEAMRLSSGRFQVIKFAASGQQFQVVLDDAAPGATSLCSPKVAAVICDGDVAFAPYGHGLVVNAFYMDGSQKMWFDDLTTKTHSLLLKLDSKMNVQLPGWDRIPVT